MLATMMCLGELSCAFPHSGSFQHYALMFIPNPIWSYTIGWLYWFSWVFSPAADLTAAGFIAHHYFTTIPVYEFCLYILIALTLVNLFQRRVLVSVNTGYRPLKFLLSCYLLRQEVS